MTAEVVDRVGAKAAGPPKGAHWSQSVNAGDFLKVEVNILLPFSIMYNVPTPLVFPSVVIYLVFFSLLGKVI